MVLNERKDYEKNTLAKSQEVDDNFISLFGGDYHFKFPIWDKNNRPDSPIENRTMGFNIDFNGLELYTSYGWLIFNGYWENEDNRPAITNLAKGSKGFNLDLSQFEGWNGENWVTLG